MMPSGKKENTATHPTRHIGPFF